MKDFSNLNEETISSKKVYDGVLLQVNKDEVKVPSGSVAVREYFNHVGASCVVAITDNNEIIVEKQFRYPFNKVITEIPAGKHDYKGADPLLTAKRELEEETGYIASKWTHIGYLYPSVAYTDEVIHMYIAQGLSRGKQKLDDDEFLNIELVPFDDFVNQIMQGKIGDAKTQIAVLKADKILNN